MLTTLDQLLVGGGLTAGGGFLAAWWQTNRADNIARKIRREERRETALLAMHYKTGEVYDRIAGIYRQAVEHGASKVSTSQRLPRCASLASAGNGTRRARSRTRIS
jgi:hypothetical protein